MQEVNILAKRILHEGKMRKIFEQRHKRDRLNPQVYHQEYLAFNPKIFDLINSVENLLDELVLIVHLNYNRKFNKTNQKI